MTARFRLKPMEHINAPETKKNFTRLLFAEVAPKYDFITKALSLGRDAAWKRKLLVGLPEKTSPVCLDLACGTGDITRMLANRYPTGRVIGLDLTPAMLVLARQRTADPRIDYLEGSMDTLPFSAASIDIVTGSYALRNASDFDQALDEIARVLRPGGKAAFLDFSKPRNPTGQCISHFILKLWGGLWGLLLHGNPDVYGYIADSLALYPNRIALRDRFAERGFTLHGSRRFYGGLLEIMLFEKEETRAEAS